MENDRDLVAILKERILVLDGATGTVLQGMDLQASDFGGPQYEGCNEHLVLTRPDAIRKVHAAYLEAGADIVETNSFGSVRHVLAEYGLQDKVLELNRAAARLAREEADRFAAPGRPRFVAGALGPGTKSISLTGGITFDEVRRYYAEAAEGLLEGGADLLLLETQQDTLNVKGSLQGFEAAFERLGRRVPVLLSVSIETMGTMLGGQNIEALSTSVEHFDLAAVGLNCATGPDFMTDHLRTLAEVSPFAVLCYPNAGLPDENGRYPLGPADLARRIRRFCDEGWVNIVGGCCGTTPEHIRAIAVEAARGTPRRQRPERRSAVSGLEPLVLESDRRPALIGERTNSVGSKLFRDMIAAGEIDRAVEVGRRQVRGGAQVLDVCLSNSDRDERTDMIRFLDALTRAVKAPIMVDSTDAAVVAAALERLPGKAIINSINLEDGEKRFGQVCGLARRYGAALVVGTIDEDKQSGMAVTRERKLAIARRCHGLLTGKYGIPAPDIYFDCLVFPCATGDKGYWGAARETIEGLRLVKAEFPACKTVLGVSNVSFGLPPAGREILNAVFLHHCVEAGLDLAIVNAEKLARYATLKEEDRSIAEEVLFWKGPAAEPHPQGADPISRFTARFRDAKLLARPADDRLKLSVDERLSRDVVEGSKEGLTQDLDALLSSGKTPLAIINGPLMRGMAEVGKRFAANELIVAEVLRSAEVMKAAVSHLEPRMDQASVAARGKLLLATVKGDVHDIGKNLVHIILKNNGFTVVDLGIKVPPEALIEAVRREAPDLIGLSGLLVKSAHQMAATADDLRAAGIAQPLLVGGAALSARFTAAKLAPRYGGPVLYARDAMAGLDLANRLQDPARGPALREENSRAQREIQAAGERAPAAAPEAPAAAGPALRTDHDIPLPPDLKRHILPEFDLDRIFAYINPVMLYGKHLGFKGDLAAKLEAGDPKAVELSRVVRGLQQEAVEKRLLRPRAVFQFFPAKAEGDSVILYDSHDGRRELERFTFPRQRAGTRLCLADFVRPVSMPGMDYVAMLVVTCGEGVLELAGGWRERGEYVKSHGLQSLALESAEGFAELLHEHLRSMWGIPDPSGLTIKEKFQCRYRGVRVSFGYPACPEIRDQAKLWRLLEPEASIGVKLTEGFMMDPEASVSALVFHHPQARYFSAVD
ncbi:MAG: methionine synthase [Elusimicrobia bacterium GWA2_69_24]|nr:MAG: methionine synthase [Elusimicrobia bacterium GWA2_69_24]